MTHRALCLLLVSLLSEARARGQPITADGTAFGSRASVVGQEISQLTTADTDRACPTGHTATAPGSFFCTASAEGGAELPGVVTVVNSGSSNTFGVADEDSPCDSMVTSTAGQDPDGDCTAAGEDKNSVVVGMPGPSALVEASNTCSQAKVSGVTGIHGKSSVQSAFINGSPVPISDSADTTISEGELIIRLNHASTIVDPATGTLSIQQDAVRIQTPGDGSVFQMLLSSAKGSLTHLPPTCPAFHCPALDLSMDATFERDQGCASSADAGDEIRFTLHVTNSGSGDGGSLFVVDRIPENTSLDPASPMLDGEAVTFDTNCPDTVTFSACPRSGTDTPQCLSVQAGNLPVGATKTVSFAVTVNSAGDVCNTAVGEVVPLDAMCNVSSLSQEVSRLILADPSCSPPTTPTTTAPSAATPTPSIPRSATLASTPTETGAPRDQLRTTGFGGCSLGPARGTGDVWPAALMGLLLIILRRRNQS